MATPQELAQQIADRSAQTATLLAQMEQRARDAATARLAPYGDTLSMYEDRFKEVYNPQMAAGIAQANAMQNYATGLGDILVRKAREARKGKETFDPYSGQYVPSLQDLLAYLTPEPAKPPVGDIFKGSFPTTAKATTPVKPTRVGAGKMQNLNARFG
jgi:hypothetical protein